MNAGIAASVHRGRETKQLAVFPRRSAALTNAAARITGHGDGGRKCPLGPGSVFVWHCSYLRPFYAKNSSPSGPVCFIANYWRRAVFNVKRVNT